jgi:hypothetical protein
MTGQPTSGKPIALYQLQTEMNGAGLSVAALGMADDAVFVYDAEGQPADFAEADRATVDQAITNHVAMRNKTDAEYAAEFQDPNTTAARKQDIRDIQNGLMPHEQVPVTQEEWDTRMTPAGVTS